MQGDFPFNWNDIYYLLGMGNVSGTKASEYVNCPFCGAQHKLNLNNIKKVYRCIKCGEYGGILGFYAEMQGITKKEAYHEINEKLGLNRDNTLVKKRYNDEHEKIKKSKTYYVPNDERDKAYRYLLSLLTLSDDHIKNLMDRGLSLPFIIAKGYRTYPTGQEELERIARQMINKGHNIVGLPGFYRNEDGKYQLRSLKRGIMVPVLDVTGRIQGFQVRKDQNLLVSYPKRDKDNKIVYQDGKPVMKLEHKFNWLSTPDMLDGGKANAYTHFSCNFIWDEQKAKKVPVCQNEWYLTEGPMKGDIFFYLMERPTICIPGVNVLESLSFALDRLKELGCEVVHDCLDMDYLVNESVADACVKIKELVKSKGMTYKRRTWDNKYKGIDDYSLYLKTK